MTKDIQNAKELFARAISDDFPIEEAIKIQAMLGKHSSQNFSSFVHAIVHFVTDRDIRQADPDYDRAQRKALQEHLQSLE